ncbi:MAG: hypothetical protein QW350_05570 [Candidatus Aenigmatarchaeota archaeon]
MEGAPLSTGRKIAFYFIVVLVISAFSFICFIASRPSIGGWFSQDGNVSGSSTLITTIVSLILGFISSLILFVPSGLPVNKITAKPIIYELSETEVVKAVRPLKTTEKTKTTEGKAFTIPVSPVAPQKTVVTPTVQAPPSQVQTFAL